VLLFVIYLVNNFQLFTMTNAFLTFFLAKLLYSTVKVLFSQLSVSKGSTHPYNSY